MSYEFEEYIRDEILSNINHMNILDDALDELDCVYAQAAKADKYEAKAKAFDEIKKARKEILVDVHERGFNLPADQDNFTLRTENIINKYESGESND